MKPSKHIILPTLTFISCPPADCSKMTITLSMSVSLCVCLRLFVCVYAYCLCMREQPSLFIMMSPVMAAKLTMCFVEQSWLDKSLCGRRCVLSTPIHLYSDLSPVEDSPLPRSRQYVLMDRWLINCWHLKDQRIKQTSIFCRLSMTT